MGRPRRAAQPAEEPDSLKQLRAMAAVAGDPVWIKRRYNPERVVAAIWPGETPEYVLVGHILKGRTLWVWDPKGGCRLEKWDNACRHPAFSELGLFFQEPDEGFESSGFHSTIPSDLRPRKVTAPGTSLTQSSAF